MSSRHPRFTSTCQQLLALGVICAALVPATNVMSLDLVPEGPIGQAGSARGVTADGVPAQLAAYYAANAVPSRVPTAPVDSTVKEVSLTAPRGARVAPSMLKASFRPRAGGGAQITSDPQQVKGYGAIGVTWQHGVAVGESDITVQVRTKGGRNDGGSGGAWTGWMQVDYHDDHGPDPDSEEARHARPGTDPTLVGDVGKVQVRIRTKDAAPADMKLAVIDPGKAARSTRELPAIDTATLPSAKSATPASLDTTDPTETDPTDPGEIDGDSTDPIDQETATLAATKVTPKPVIYSRAQWGADERMRDKSSLHYYEVHAGFVHHTVNANDYTRDQVPAILRGIYAYHTRSRGWSDIGYNYLIDRFGRIWEGRYGGVDRPVVGAHTLGYNDDSFAASAIGNYDIKKPSQKMIQAYGALFAWKLSLHGVNAASKKQWVTKRYFQAINGHRDAAATACPGKYLYARIPDIRKLASQAQVGFAGRQLESNLAATAQPDIIARRMSDNRAVVLPIVQRKNGTYKLGKSIVTTTNLKRVNALLNVGDWNRDGYGDLVTRRTSDGVLAIRYGNGRGQFAAAKPLATGFKGVRLLAAVGDVTGDGYPDLMGQPKGGSMRIYPGNGTQGLKPGYAAYSGITAKHQIGIGRWDSDGAPDSLFRNGRTLSVLKGNGPGGLTGSARRLNIDLAPYNWVIGINDVGLTKHADLVVRAKADGNLYLIQATNSSFAQPVLLKSKVTNFDLAD